MRVIPFGDTSKILTAYAREVGVVSLLAKGVRSPKPRFGGALELFSYADLVYYNKESRDLQLLSQASLLEANLSLSTDWVRYVYGSAVLELIRRLVVGQEPGGKLYPLTQRTLECLGDAPLDTVPQVFRAFEIKAATFLGHGPQLFSCVGCGRTVIERAGFAPLRGGLVCSTCFQEREDAQPVSMAVLGIMRRWLGSPLADLYREPPSRAVFRSASALIERFMKTHWDKYDLRTLRTGHVH